MEGSENKIQILKPYKFFSAAEVAEMFGYKTTMFHIIKQPYIAEINKLAIRMLRGDKYQKRQGYHEEQIEYMALNVFFIPPKGYVIKGKKLVLDQNI